MPIVDVELKRDVPRPRRGYVKYAATAIAAVLFLHGAATVALHHRLHDQGHGRHHSIDGDQDRPPPPEPADALPPAAHAPGSFGGVMSVVQYTRRSVACSKVQASRSASSAQASTTVRFECITS